MKVSELLQEAPWTKLGKHKGVLTRTLTPADVEQEPAKEKARQKRKDDDLDRQVRQDEKEDLQKLANEIQRLVSNSVPDMDPIDQVERFTRKLYNLRKAADFLPYVDKAVKTFLSAKNYNAYFDNMIKSFHEQK